MTESLRLVPAYETLRAFIARAESALNAALEYAEGHREAEVREHVEGARLALNTLLDENERLREALKPIADLTEEDLDRLGTLKAWVVMRGLIYHCRDTLKSLEGGNG